ncbi:BRCT domain-containing protein [Lentzea sp. NPDC051213]|uniref:BRCT domain-containing protein n=1 Tax=Lentzea sp. NPDC051213 TaxID=3364126 RepID=UPI0037A7F31E
MEPLRVSLTGHHAKAFAVQRSSIGGQEQHFLAKLVGLLPRVKTPRADDYLDVLDRALVDRQLSLDEQDELLDVARELDLGLPEVMELHRGYLTALAEAAWEDGLVSGEEEADLRLVASLLGLGQREVADVLGGERRFRLSSGDRVVFTGQMREPRDVWESRAQSAGLDVTGGVTKRTRLVVAADPHSMSGKAGKARTYGIPIVSEDLFAGLLGDLTGSAR